MIARAVRLEENMFDLVLDLVLDRDAIVRAALRAYIEYTFARMDPLERLSPVCSGAEWTGDLQRGAFYNANGCGSYEIVAWTEAGVVGLAYELGFGPLEQLGLALDAITRGPEDVRAAVPGLPSELSPAFVMAADLLPLGTDHGEKLAGVGFWLHGDRAGGTLFEDSTAFGGWRLACWGALQDGRLPPPCDPEDIAEIAAENARRGAAPIEALVDAVTARAFRGPTELTTDELATLLPTPLDPKRLVYAQQCLQKVGVTWPGSPEIPEELPPSGANPSLQPVTTTILPSRHGDCVFEQETIVRVALRTYVEAVFVQADPLRRHDFPPCADPRWTGDLHRGAFYNGDGRAAYDVVAWTEAGLVALACEAGVGPIEQLGLPVDAVTRGPDDLRAALPELPTELGPALVMAAGMLEEGGKHGEKLPGVGFWLHGDRVGGSLFHNRSSAGGRRLAAWSLLNEGRLLLVNADYRTIVLYAAKLARMKEPLLRAMVDAVTARVLAGPTELTADELATLLPTPPDPERLVHAQQMLRKVGITWPGKHPS